MLNAWLYFIACSHGLRAVAVPATFSQENFLFTSWGSNPLTWVWINSMIAQSVTSKQTTTKPFVSNHRKWRFPVCTKLKKYGFILLFCRIIGPVYKCVQVNSRLHRHEAINKFPKDHHSTQMVKMYETGQGCAFLVYSWWVLPIKTGLFLSIKLTHLVPVKSSTGRQNTVHSYKINVIDLMQIRRCVSPLCHQGCSPFGDIIATFKYFTIDPTRRKYCSFHFGYTRDQREYLADK